MGVSWTATILAFVMVAPEPIPIRFEPIISAQRTPGQERAVVLIHGLHPHPIREANVMQPDLSAWEKPGSTIVKALSAHADLFALGYGQNRTVDEVAKAPAIKQAIESLRTMGYKEVVLIGHSAGGLIARYYVENEAGGGVNKVIQVCSPNGGSSWGNRTSGVRENQEMFLTSLTKEARQKVQYERANRTIPANVEFVCVVGSIGKTGDGFVRSDCQWTADLQRQGVPAVVLRSTHVTAMYSKTVVGSLTELVREPQPRWTPGQVEALRSRMFHEK